MVRFVKRILVFLSLFLAFFVVKEMVGLYSYLVSINLYLAYCFLVLLGVAIIYFIAIPIYEILKMPVGPSPTTHSSQKQKVITKRMRKFRTNPLILTETDGLRLGDSEEDYEKALTILSKESKRIQKKYVSQVFYRTGIVQNGFLDALLILSSNMSLIREMFILYNGRVSNRDIWNISKQVYYSLVIGGSESVEYATEEIFSKMATEGMKNVPFLDKVMSSMADGYVNAVLTTRVALITENYCTKTYVKSYSELYPDASYLIQTAKNLTGSMIENIYQALKNTVSEKTVDVLLKAGNPVGYLFEKGIDATFPGKNGEDSKLKKNLKSGFSFIGNPILYGIERLVNRSREKQKLLKSKEDQ